MNTINKIIHLRVHSKVLNTKKIQKEGLKKQKSLNLILNLLNLEN